MMARTEDFERYRSLLFSIAYRMLGSVTDAEDIVQEAYLRWREAPKAVITRLSIDRLRSARVQREEYVGPWLPEPLVSEGTEDVADYHMVHTERVLQRRLVGETRWVSCSPILRGGSPTSSIPSGTSACSCLSCWGICDCQSPRN